MPEVIDNVEEAESIRETFLDTVEVPDAYTESDWTDYPEAKEYAELPPDFPEEYVRQYEVAGYNFEGGYVEIWWLGDGIRLQPYFDTDEPYWGDVGGFDYIQQQMEQEVGE